MDYYGYYIIKRRQFCAAFISLLFSCYLAVANGSTLVVITPSVGAMTVAAAALIGPPDAVDDGFSTLEGIPVGGDVLANDSDPDGDNLTVTIPQVSGPSNGSVILNGNGTFTYTPDPGFTGTDVFEYEVCDDAVPSLCSRAFVFIAVNCSGAGQFTEVAGTVGLDLGGAKDGGLAWGDLDNDGDLDVIVNTSDATEHTRMYFSSGGANPVFTDVTASHAAGLLDSLMERSIVIADLNNDGYLDFIRNTAFSSIEVFYNKGPGASPAFSFGDASQDPNLAITQVTPPDLGFNTEGLGVIDWNSDGWLDIIADNHNYGIEIFENDQAGGFTYRGPGVTGLSVTEIGAGDYTAVADYDNDGFVDFMGRKSTGENLWKFDSGTGQFALQPFPNSLADNNNKGAVTFCDFDNDGDFDLFWTDNGANQIWRNDAGTFVATGLPTEVNGIEGIDECACGDIDNDGDMDLFLGSNLGNSFLYINNSPKGGPLSFTLDNMCMAPNANVEGSQFVDYDHDGDVDLYMNIRSGANQLWRNSLNNSDYLFVEALVDLGGGLTRPALGANITVADCNGVSCGIREVNGGTGHGSQKPTKVHFGLSSGPNATYQITVYFADSMGTRKVVTKTVTPSLLTNQTVTILSTDQGDTGNADNFTVVNPTVNSPGNATGTADGSVAQLLAGAILDLDLTDVAASGERVLLRLQKTGVPASIVVSQSSDGISFTNPRTFIVNSSSPKDLVYEILASDARYIRLDNQSSSTHELDAITYPISSTQCNNPILATMDFENLDEDTNISGDVIVNDSNPDGDPLTVSLITNVTSGTLLLNSDGSFTYTPDANFNGTDSFVYEVCDDTTPTNICAQAMVSIAVNPINDPPTAVDDPSETTSEDTRVVNSVLVNDSDAEGDPLTIVSITQPANGTVVNNGNGTITYTPFPNFSGVNTYTYTIYDGNGGTSTATVTMTVSGFNDPPIANLDIFATLEDIPTTFDVLDNDLDVDGDAVSIDSFTLTSDGTLVQNGDDTFTYTPDLDFYGLDSFTYTISDGNGETDNTTVTIVVAAINDPPIAVNDTTITNEDQPITLNVTINDTDIEGDPLQVVIVTQGGNGSVINNNNGTLTYVPFANYSGIDTFTYTITDGNGGISTASVMVTIVPVNDAPIAVDDFASTPEGTRVTIIVLANDLDVDGDVINVTSVTQPPEGQVNVRSDGTIRYEPVDDDFTGTETFTYTITDGNGRFDTGTVTVVVGPINDDPIARDDGDVTEEDQKVTTNVLANDIDPEKNPLVVFSVTQGLNGMVINNNDGTITYVPRPNYNGVDTYTYAITDGQGGTATALVSIIVLPVNDAPVAVLDIVSTLEDTPVTYDVMDNDFDIDGDPITVVKTTQGTNGTVVNNGDGTITYTPNANFTGVDTYTYEISDGLGEFSTALVSIWVGIINDPPVAIDDIANTFEDLPVTTDVLANDSDPENDVLTVIIVTQPSFGMVLDNGDGTITYTPLLNFSGTDSYTYTITDNKGGVATATVTVIVDNANDDPMAIDDFGSSIEEIPTTTNVLANDIDPEGDVLTITSVTQPGNGTVVDNGDGTVTYTPRSNFNGTDTYSYSITDGNGGSATATVSIFINPLQDPPTAVDDIVSTPMDVQVTSNVLANDFDVDGDVISIINVVPGANGSVVNNGDGTITYTPNSGFTGVDIITYTITDGKGSTSSATVTIYVGIANTPPAAMDDSEITDEDIPATTNVLANDSDADSDPISISSITQPANGVTVDNGDGTVTYTPDLNFNGPDSYTYTITDGRGGTSTATVSITVNPINNPPIANDDFENTNEDTPVILGVLINDTDVDGDILNIVGFSQGSNGTVTDNGDGTLTYQPNANFSGTDTFTYIAGDGNGGADGATVTIVVGAVNDSPNAIDDTDITDEDISITTDVLSNDSDPEGDPISIVSVTQPANGSIVDNGDGTITYTPDTNFNGANTYTYTITDGNGGLSSGLVTITVNSINDPPLAIEDLNNTTDEDITVDINVVINDSDVDGTLDLSSIAIITPASNGNLVDNGDGTLTYTPDPDFNGPDAFSYTISDNDGAVSNIVDVEITVLDINDPPVALNDTTATSEEIAVVINVAANDTDLDGTIDVTTVGRASSPLNGTVVINGDGTVTYTPDLGFAGLDSLSYTIDDNDGATSQAATVYINVINVNDNPVAVNDTLNATEDTVLNLSAPGVLTNDTDPEGDPLSVTGNDALSTQGGTVVVNVDGSVNYIPPPNYNGVDSFSYSIGDGNGGSSSATVVINVIGVNDPPVALNDTTSTNEETSVVINVITNDTDIDGSIDAASVTIVTPPGDGQVTVNGDGTITYTPDLNFTGIDSLHYTVNDNNGSTSNLATVIINVDNINDPPIAVDDNYSINEDTPLIIVAPGVIGNDIDLEGDILSVSAFDNLSTNGGVVLVNADGSFNYTPPMDFAGTDSFTYTIDDGNGGTDVATATIDVAPVNDNPIAADDSYSTNENTQLVISTPGLLSNDTDADGDPVAVSGFDAISVNGGTVSVNANGSFDYTPPAGFVGSDTFTYTIDDGNGGSDNATVTIVIDDVNDQPNTVDDNYLVNEDNVVSVTDPLLGLLGNDSDPEGDNLSVNTTPVTAPSNGTVLLNADGTFSYTPDPDFNGVDSFIYEVCDDGTPSQCNQATVIINVIAQQDTPTAVNDSLATVQDTPLNIPAPGILSNDSDVDGDVISVIALNAVQTSGGILIWNPDGSFDYTPPAGFTGVEIFEYTISDGNGGTDIAELTVSVLPLNIAPLAVDDMYTTEEDLSVSGNVLDNDSDPEGQNLIVNTAPVSAPMSGSVTITSDGSFTYTPNPGFSGTDSFIYEVCDDGVPSQCAQATATVEVTPFEGLIIYQGVSPNNDGSNDVWTIQGIERYPDNYVQIFNRWGSKIYQARGYNNVTVFWEGQSTEGIIFGDEVAPDGTYFYVLDLGDGSELYSGYIVLRK